MLLRTLATGMAVLVLALQAGGVTQAEPLGSEPSPGAIDRAFRNAQLAAAPGSGAALAEGAARVAAGDPALRALLDESRSAEQQRRALEAVLASLRAQGAGAADRARGVAADLERAVADSQSARRRLTTSYPRFVDLTDPEPASIVAAQALLHPNEALVMILPSERGTYIWAVTPQEARWVRTGLDAAAVAALSEALLESVRPAGGRGAVDAARPTRGDQPGEYARSTAWKLYSELWAPVEPLIQSVQTVYVVADGPLGAVPPGILITRAPEGRDGDPQALRDTAWFARDHAFVQLPAVASLRTVRLPSLTTGSGFAGFGDARLQNYPEGSAGKALAPLPGTRRELQSLARLFRADRHALHLGDQATEQALKTADLERVTVLALATHTLPVDGRLPTEPALVFTPPLQAQGDDDGFLTASEAAQLSLGANLVILSACDTARDDPDASAINSLSRAFFHAGARSLLVSNWRIRDDVAARLSTDTLGIARRDGATLAEAARQAALRMLSDRSDPTFSHPAQWAAFSVLGDGSVTF